MRRLIYLADARQNLTDIAKFISRESGHTIVGRKFVAKIRTKCKMLASRNTILGRARPDLERDIRSLAFENYLIFFRYGPDRVEIVNVVHGGRDLEAYFERKKWDLDDGARLLDELTTASPRRS